MDKISFQGLTNLSISPTGFRKVEDSTRKAYTNLRRSTNYRLFKNQTYTVQTDPAYLTVLVKNEDDGFYKYVPLNGKIDRYMEEITHRIDELRMAARKQPLTAWIIGGTRFESPQGEKVVKTLNKIADTVCEKADIDASILVGSNTGEELFVIRPGVQQLKMVLDKDIKPNCKLQDEIENMFDVVDLNKTTLSYEA